MLMVMNRFVGRRQRRKKKSKTARSSCRKDMPWCIREEKKKQYVNSDVFPLFFYVSYSGHPRQMLIDRLTNVGMSIFFLLTGKDKYRHPYIYTLVRRARVRAQWMGCGCVDSSRQTLGDISMPYLLFVVQASERERDISGYRNRAEERRDEVFLYSF